MIRVCSGAPHAWLARYRGKRPLFACILSFTDTGTIPGISAAGKTPQARRHTALADGEFLLNGECWLDSSQRSSSGRAQMPIHDLPPLRAGVSPALISRAIVTHQKIPCCLLSTGLPGELSVPHIALPRMLASSLETGQAMTPLQVHALWQSGLRWGRLLSRIYAGSYLILGECVVGGTTTAQALLTALGYDVAGQMSSSHLGGNHSQKRQLVNAGLSIWQQQQEMPSALSAVAAIGDPMQVVASAMAMAASRKMGVLLAGGSQMLAVYALIKTISRAIHSPMSSQIVVGTTRWVVEDEQADTIAIAQAVEAPYLASELDFRGSLYAELRAYEQGFVKEGMGAGGCAIAANLYEGWGRSQIMHVVEAELRHMKLRK